MFKKSLIALTMAATMSGAFAVGSTPAAAYERPWMGSHHRHDRCFTKLRRERIWTSHGPRWVTKRIRICR